MKSISSFVDCLFFLLVFCLDKSFEEDISNDPLNSVRYNLSFADNRIDASDQVDIHPGKKTSENESIRIGSFERESQRQEPSNTATEGDLEDEEAFPDLWPRALALEGSPTVSLSKASDKESFAAHQPNNTEVLAQVGGTATLSCYTGHISDEVVTWLKRQDDKLLTIGQEVYGNEDRFSASLSHTTKAWELFVKEIQLSDAGQYECQLTTHPPVTFFFTLKVKQAKAVVTGPREVHIEEGSQLALQCQVQDAPYPPIYIFWYHNKTMVNYERKRDLQVHHENFTSSLVIAKVTSSDAGIYSCEPHLATSANVVIHVVTGEKPAAMQHGRKENSGSSNLFFLKEREFSLYSAFSYFFLLVPSIVIVLNIFPMPSKSMVGIHPHQYNGLSRNV